MPFTLLHRLEAPASPESEGRSVCTLLLSTSWDAVALQQPQACLSAFLGCCGLAAAPHLSFCHNLTFLTVANDSVEQMVGGSPRSDAAYWHSPAGTCPLLGPAQPRMLVRRSNLGLVSAGLASRTAAASLPLPILLISLGAQHPILPPVVLEGSHTFDGCFSLRSLGLTQLSWVGLSGFWWLRMSLS